MSSHVARRVDDQPVGWPSATGDEAKAAASAGPTRWATRHRRAHSSSSPWSRLTCSAAVRDIIRRPATPSTSKNASMAS
jgi:hypothetical protein